MTSLRWFASLMIVLPLLLASCSGRGAPPPPKPPNVFFILVDTLRADRVSWYEPASAQPPLTPFLRALAEHGTVFWNAYAQSSWTQPSIASVFTSRYPSQHSATQYNSILPAEEQTLAEAFKAGGYRTGGFLASLIGVPQYGYGQGFDSFGFVAAANDHEGKGRAEQINAAGLAWLDRLPSGNAASPIFLYLHYMEPHIPYDPPSATLQAIASRRGPDAKRLHRAERAQQWVKGIIAALQTRLPVPARAADIDDDIILGVQDLYDAEVASLDIQLRALFEQLQTRGLLTNSFIVITADHGDEFWEHGIFGHGNTLYNEVLHVPLLFIAPSQTRRIDVRDTVSLIDIAPTLLDYSGIVRPNQFEGRSLRGVIDRAHGWRRWITTVRRLAGGGEHPTSSYSELFPYIQWQHDDRQFHCRSVIADAHKLIARADGSTEAYDLAADPAEHAAASRFAAVSADLRESLSRFAERMGRSNVAPLVAPLDEKARERLHALGYTQ